MEPEGLLPHSLELAT